MARETQNQGLQVALIVFVTLTMLLSVTTFLFFQQFDETRNRARSSLDETDRLRATVAAQQEEIGQLKRLIGYPATIGTEKIQEQLAQDVQLCAAALPEEQRFYRPMLICLQDSLRTKNAELGRCKAETQQWQARYAALESIKAEQVKQFQDAVAKAGQDLLAVEETARKGLDRGWQEKGDLLNKMVKNQSEANSAQAEARKKIEELASQYGKAAKEAAALRAQIDGLTLDEFTRPQGEICGISYRLRTAWIDLGRADALRPATAFNVYPTGATRLTKPSKKGEIEVTKVLDDHLAEARIMDEKISDPILQGDKVHAPRWLRGARP